MGDSIIRNTRYSLLGKALTLLLVLLWHGTAMAELRFQTPREVNKKCVMVESLVATDDNMLIWNAEKNLTVKTVSCRTSSFTTQPTITFEDGSGNSMTGNPTCNGTETQAWTSITAGGVITAYESIRFDTTNTPAPTTATQALICFSYEETS